MTDNEHKSKPMRATAPVVPLIVGPGNALAATGFSWRWLRDFWEARGRAFVGASRKRGIPAAALLDELARAGASGDVSEVPAQPEDPAAAVRRAIGLVAGAGR